MRERDFTHGAQDYLDYTEKADIGVEMMICIKTAVPGFEQSGEVRALRLMLNDVST